MIYIILSNVGLAIMTVIIYFRYSHFRITSIFKIRDLEKRLAAETKEKEHSVSTMKEELKSEVGQVKKLLNDLQELRKEKEDEMRLRLEAEKQIEIALQKTQEIQKRMSDWRNMQEAAMEDSKMLIEKSIHEIYEKIVKSHKDESAESRASVEKTITSVNTYLDNISKTMEILRHKNEMAEERVERAVSSAAGSIAKAAPVQLDASTKKLLDSVISNIMISGHLPNKVYVIAANLTEEKLRSMLCDLIFIKDTTAYLIDFKANRYFAEYSKLKTIDNKAALETLQQRLNKYFVYLSNPKYKAILKKLLTDMKMKFTDVQIVFAVPTRNEISLLKEIHYLERAKKLAIEANDIDTINDLVL